MSRFVPKAVTAMFASIALSCSCAPQRRPISAATDASSAKRAANTKDAASTKGAGEAGTPCDPEAGDAECQQGLSCSARLGGHCTAPCADRPCPSGVCVESPKMGQWCLGQCTTDRQCPSRMTCDEHWDACSPMVLPPRPPTCTDEAPLPRRSFSKPMQLSSGPRVDQYHTEPSAALTGDGSLVIAYIGHDVALPEAGRPQPNGLGVAVVKPDGTVVRDRVMPTRRQNQFDPWLGSDRKGTVFATWLGFDGPTAPERNMHVGINRTDNGRDWAALPDAQYAATDCPNEQTGCLDKPMLAIGPDASAPDHDALYVAYYSAPAGGTRLVKSLDLGKRFGPSVALSDGAYGDLSVDNTGVLHHVFAQASPVGPLTADGSYVGYTFSVDGGATVATPFKVSRADQQVPFYFSNPQVTADPEHGVVYVVYPAGDALGRWDIWLATSKDAGRTWRHTRVNDDASCANHMLPAVALDPQTHELHVMWNENRGGQGAVAYSRCQQGGASCGPNERVSDAPFSAYRWVRHTPTWLGEYNALVIDGPRRALHAVWTQPVREGEHDRTRIFHARAAL
ncbi:MAG: sialidase family protein [Myxococcales bacterium]|nr:sialidase family protein [Myxococcales bacterium]MDD9967914.1 sialidase family protein [Myxococcales bacterium]